MNQGETFGNWFEIGQNSSNREREKKKCPGKNGCEEQSKNISESIRTYFKTSENNRRSIYRPRLLKTATMTHFSLLKISGK